MAGQVGADFRQRPGAPHLQPLDHSRLGQVVVRQDEAPAPGSPRGQRHRERAADGAKVALEPHLADDHEAAKAVVGKLAARHQDAERDWQVEPGPLLADVGRRQIDGNPLEWELESGVGQRRSDALPPLAHRAVRQSDGGERGQAVADVDLDVDGIGVDAEDGGGADAGKHAGT